MIRFWDVTSYNPKIMILKKSGVYCQYWDGITIFWPQILIEIWGSVQFPEHPISQLLGQGPCKVDTLSILFKGKWCWDELILTFIVLLPFSGKTRSITTVNSLYITSLLQLYHLPSSHWKPEWGPWAILFSPTVNSCVICTSQYSRN